MLSIDRGGNSFLRKAPRFIFEAKTEALSFPYGGAKKSCPIFPPFPFLAPGEEGKPNTLLCPLAVPCTQQEEEHDKLSLLTFFPLSLSLLRKRAKNRPKSERENSTAFVSPGKNCTANFLRVGLTKCQFLQNSSLKSPSNFFKVGESSSPPSFPPSRLFQSETSCITSARIERKGGSEEENFFFGEGKKPVRVKQASEQQERPEMGQVGERGAS